MHLSQNISTPSHINEFSDKVECKKFLQFILIGNHLAEKHIEEWKFHKLTEEIY